MPVINRRSPYRNWRIDQAWGQDFTINRASLQATGLVSWFPPLGIPGNTLRDFIRSVAATTFGDPVQALDPIVGPVIDFDGTDDYINLNTNPVISGNSVTVSCWIKRMNGAPVYWVRGKDGAGAGWSMRLWADLTFSIVTAVPVAAISVAGNAINDGTIHHICCVWRNGVEIEIYQDGLFVNNQATANMGLRASTIGFHLARTNAVGAVVYECQHGDFRIYNRALSAGEIWNLFAPSTRWDLYKPTPRAFFMFLPIAPTGAPILTMGGGYSLPVG